MSSYSFSHQFYQHWTGAPEPVRAAIVQELTDITDLLQTETEFEKFVFSTHDLDAHLDDLYCIYDLQQAAAAKKQADEQVAAQQRLDEQKQLEEAENEMTEKRRQQAEQQQAERQQIEALAYSENAADTINNNEDNKTLSGQDTQNNRTANRINLVQTIANNLNKDSAISSTLKPPEPHAEHNALVSELEGHIDDYLTEQMLQMSENLKLWLRAEVSRQLTDKKQTVDNK